MAHCEASGSNFLGLGRASLPRRYAADFNAVDVHALVRGQRGPGVKAYFYGSDESLVDAPLADIDRRGFAMEPEMTFRPEGDRLKAVSLFARYRLADESIPGEDLRRIQYGAGIELALKRTLKMRFAYPWPDEAEDARGWTMTSLLSGSRRSSERAWAT